MLHVYELASVDRFGTDGLSSSDFSNMIGSFI